MREDEPSSLRSELLERLRSLESSQSQTGLSDLAYRRAREALERALEEARNIRLQAIEDVRQAREHELNALMEQLRSLRQSAETQIDTLLRTAELESQRMREQARTEAQQIMERATDEAARTRADAQAIRAAADERMREIQRIESEFNDVLAEVAERLGMDEKPSEGWLKRIFGGR